MQNRYVGDVGDYVKLAILRTLSVEKALGVAWWLYPDENHNGNGRHIGYLDRPEEWRDYDPDVFDALRIVVESGERRVERLEAAGLLPGARFFGEVIPTGETAVERRRRRRDWFERLQTDMSDRDLIFLDPDNGLETRNFDPGGARAGKSVSVQELQSLRREGRGLIVYHHQTRMPGGHQKELAHWGARLRDSGFRTVDALRASAYSVRAFFLLDADDLTRGRARMLAERWGRRLTWHPDPEGPVAT
ncbi:MAG: hypothetical protein ABI056_08260 [Caulobacteraceae bacterium]